MRQRGKLRIVAHYIIVEGERVPINPYEMPELADRCKVAIAEMVTGHKFELVQKSDS